MTTPELRQELLNLAERATATPWYWEPEYGNVNTTPDPESDHVLCGCCWHAKDDPDYLYAVAAANLAPGLVRDVERLTESNREAARVLTGMVTDGDLYGGRLNSLVIGAVNDLKNARDSAERLAKAIEAAPHGAECASLEYRAAWVPPPDPWPYSYPVQHWVHAPNIVSLGKLCNCWKAALTTGEEKKNAD